MFVRGEFDKLSTDAVCDTLTISECQRSPHCRHQLLMSTKPRTRHTAGQLLCGWWRVETWRTTGVFPIFNVFPLVANLQTRDGPLLTIIHLITILFQREESRRVVVVVVAVLLELMLMMMLMRKDVDSAAHWVGFTSHQPPATRCRLALSVVMATYCSIECGTENICLKLL